MRRRPESPKAPIPTPPMHPIRGSTTSTAITSMSARPRSPAPMAGSSAAPPGTGSGPRCGWCPTTSACAAASAAASTGRFPMTTSNRGTGRRRRRSASPAPPPTTSARPAPAPIRWRRTGTRRHPLRPQGDAAVALFAGPRWPPGMLRQCELHPDLPDPGQVRRHRDPGRRRARRR